MEGGAVAMKLTSLNLNVPGAYERPGGSRSIAQSTQVRSESGSNRHSRESQKHQQQRQVERKAIGDHLLGAPRGQAPVVAKLVSSAAQSDPLEEFVQQDLDFFWRWCPTPFDGLHRCGLLVKLFDYCGLTRKGQKIAQKVRRLDTELRALGVLATDQIEPHQRVPYEAFVQSRQLRDAVLRCSEVRAAFDTIKKRPGKCEEGRTPLALWVMSIISQEVVGAEAPPAA
mmetsp:Transcript_81144/g.173616  ORF Transcript_81144/g.173616 Transcript_81144/m.173616 type:complete len:227 (+) Transcript_81144:138-818(+)